MSLASRLLVHRIGIDLLDPVVDRLSAAQHRWRIFAAIRDSEQTCWRRPTTVRISLSPDDQPSEHSLIGTSHRDGSVGEL